VQGLLQGDVVLWWEDGTLQGVGAYEQGLAQGCHARWHRDGRRAARGAYLDGVKVGRWVYWDQQGQRSREQHEGQPSKGRCWWPMF
jgi:antitoxin component YwqK of YwqJK toxin-antitoxin module